MYDDYTSSFDELLRKDKSLSFHHRNIHLVAIEIYKAKNNLSPPFMKEIFVSTETRETRAGDKIVRPNVNKVNSGERTLASFGAIIWNTMIPKKLKLCADLEIFKLSLKSWIPENCPCVLCKIWVGCVGYADLFE